MAWIDSCCLQLVIKSRSGRDERSFTFQTESPDARKDWVIGNETFSTQSFKFNFICLNIHFYLELRYQKASLDPKNSPAWDIPEQERRPSTKIPLFVKALPVYKSNHETEVNIRFFCIFIFIFKQYFIKFLYF